MRPDKTVEWISIDIELVNLGSALEFTRQKLREIGAPAGSVVEYRVGGNKVIEPI